MWNAEDGEQVGGWLEQQGDVMSANSVSWNPDGEHLLVGYEGNMTRHVCGNVR